MAIYTEDQIVGSINLDTVLPEEVKEKESLDPTFLETSKAAFERENLLAGAFKDRQVTDPNFNFLEHIKDTPYENNSTAFIYADSIEEIEKVKESIDNEVRNNQILDESGWTGTVMQMVAGTLDPTILVPGGKLIQGASKISRLGKGAAQGALLGATAVGTQEALLQQQQETRPIEESIMATMAGGVFGGVLGGAVSLAKGSDKLLGDTVTQSILRNEDIKINLDDTGKATGVDMRSASAAEVDPRTLRTEESVADINERVFKALSLTTEKSGGLGNPLSQGLTSKSGLVKKLTNHLFEHNYILNKNKAFVRSDDAMETILKVDTAKNLKLNKGIEELYIKSVGLEGSRFGKWKSIKQAQTGKGAKWQDFSDAVAKGLRRGGSDIPEVDQAVKMLRKEMDDQATKLVDNGIMEGLDPQVAKNYLTRRWNTDAIALRRTEFEKKLFNDFKAKNGGVDDDILQVKASNAVDNILGLGDESLEISSVSRDMMRTKSGKFTKSRVLDIDDTNYEEFLNNDGVGNAMSYITQANNLNRFQETLQRMNVESVADLKKQIRSEMESLARVEKISTDDIKRSMDLVDQQVGVMLGQFGNKNVTDDAFRVLRKYQTVRLLGGVAISSLPDMAMPVFKHGFGRTIKDGWAPLLRSIKKSKLSRDQWSDFNIGLELEQNELLKNLVDPDFSVGRSRNAIERYSDVGMQTFGNITGMNYWNRFGKRMGAHMSSARTIRSVQNLDNISPKEIKRLASLGIDKDLGARINSQFKKFGQVEQGSYISNISKWTDADAKKAFGQSVLKDTDSTIVTPGRGDLPTVVQKSELAKTLFQFKSFPAAATRQILLSGLQRRDSEVLSGISALIAMGAMVHGIKETISGRDPDLSFDNALKEGISRSGVAGLVGDIAFLTAPGLNSSRFASYNTKDAMLGPTFSQASDIPDMMNRMSDGELSDSDKKKMHRWLPLHNLFYLRILYDQVNGNK